MLAAWSGDVCGNRAGSGDNRGFDFFSLAFGDSGEKRNRERSNRLAVVINNTGGIGFNVRSKFAAIVCPASARNLIEFLIQGLGIGNRVRRIARVILSDPRVSFFARQKRQEDLPSRARVQGNSLARCDTQRHAWNACDGCDDQSVRPIRNRELGGVTGGVTDAPQMRHRQCSQIRVSVLRDHARSQRQKPRTKRIAALRISAHHAVVLEAVENAVNRGARKLYGGDNVSDIRAFRALFENSKDLHCAIDGRHTVFGSSTIRRHDFILQFVVGQAGISPMRQDRVNSHLNRLEPQGQGAFRHKVEIRKQV